VPEPGRTYVAYSGPLGNSESPQRTPFTSPLSVPFDVLAAALTNLGLQDQISATTLYDVLDKERRSRPGFHGASSHHTSTTINQPHIEINFDPIPLSAYAQAFGPNLGHPHLTDAQHHRTQEDVKEGSG
jgi:hypothetical protein